jgi:hypothetical protein
LFALLAASSVWAAPRDLPFCQILDRADQPAWEVQGVYRNRAAVDAPGGRRYSVYEVRGGGGLFFSDAPGGSVEVGGAYAGQAYEGNGGVGLPDQVLDLHLDVAYVGRHWDGRSLRLRIQPGLYGEVDGLDLHAFSMPFEVTGIQALSPRLSGLLGVVVYPGFSRTLDPRFGVRYALTDTWSLDLQYPESRLLWRAADGQEVYALIRNDPINEYRLQEDDPRRAFRWEESRAALGWVLPLGSLLRLRLEAGYAFNRSVDFSRGAVPRAVDDAALLVVGLGGPL